MPSRVEWRGHQVGLHIFHISDTLGRGRPAAIPHHGAIATRAQRSYNFAMSIREPAVAGFFYPLGEEELLAQVDGFLPMGANPKTVKLVIMPHAGYVYSGPTAGVVAAAVQVPSRVILLGPKHRAGGARAAVSSADSWRMPFGDVPIDREMVRLLAGEAGIEADDRAHADEHSLEVEIPFLWRRNPAIRITPVALGVHSLDELKTMGQAVAAAVATSGDPVLLVASTDMSHQIPLDRARRLDGMAIDRILDLDPEGLYETVFSNRISMCGVIPVTAALFAARAMGAAAADLIGYTTSADASGDTSAVVGYAGIVVE